ncbi:7tm 7 domain containing protein, partial [Asbolus verrucosus]
MIEARFVILNKEINNLVKGTQLALVGKRGSRYLPLNQICALHHHLSKLITLFNDIFGVILLLMFGVSFTIMVLVIFLIAVELQASHTNWFLILVRAVSTLSFFVDTIYVCDVCYTTIEEANKSAELIHKIETEDHDMRDRIEMFSLQIANDQVEFSAAGFFPINYTLVFSVKFLVKIVDFDVKLHMNAITINYGRSRKKMLFQQMGRLIYLSLLITFLVVSTAVPKKIYIGFGQISGYVLLIINSASCHQSIELISMIEARFVILNKQINNLVKGTQLALVGKHGSRYLPLNQICALHHHLSKLITLFNDIFGVILLLMFGVSFTVMVLVVLYIVVQLQASHTNWFLILVRMVSSLSFFVDPFYVCDVCYANKSAELIHKIETEDHDLRDRIEMFSLQIANNQVEFNAAGFFPINYTLVFSHKISFLVLSLSTKLRRVFVRLILDFDHKIVNKVSQVLVVGFGGIYVVVTWICSIVNREKFMEFLVRMIDFDVKLYTNSIIVNYERSRRKILYQLVGRLVYLSLLSTVSVVYFPMSSEIADILGRISGYVLIIINSATCHQCIESISMIRARFVILNKQINNLINRSQLIGEPPTRLLPLNQICALHHHLSKLITLFNDIFGVILLLMFGANKSAELIHKIETEDHDVRDRIEMFSLQMANEQVEFNAAGFFPINYTLVFSITGGVTTYITDHININYQKNKQKILFQIYVRHIWTTLYISCFIFSGLSWRLFEQLYLITAFLFLTINSVNCHQAIELISLLKSRFAILNEQISDLVEFADSNIETVDKTANFKRQYLSLRKICSLHHHLSRLITLFNETFGLVLLVTFGVSFVMISLSLFFAMVVLSQKDISWLHVLYTLTISVSFVVDTIYVCDAAEAGELMHKIETEDRDIIDRIEMFSLQIINRPVEFNAAGFFPINYTLIF